MVRCSCCGQPGSNITACYRHPCPRCNPNYQPQYIAPWQPQLQEPVYRYQPDDAENRRLEEELQREREARQALERRIAAEKLQKEREAREELERKLAEDSAKLQREREARQALERRLAAAEQDNAALQRRSPIGLSAATGVESNYDVDTQSATPLSGLADSLLSTLSSALGKLNLGDTVTATPPAASTNAPATPVSPPAGASLLGALLGGIGNALFGATDATALPASVAGARGGAGASPAAGRSPPGGADRVVRIRKEELTFNGGHLGSGGFGSVVKGVYKGEKVAIKMLNISDVTPASFWKEAETVYTMRHDHLVVCHGACVEELPPFYAIVMELCNGTLMEYLEGKIAGTITTGGRASTAERLVRLKQVAHGLKFLHACGKAHLDIKPANVLVRVTPEGTTTLRISDFGLVKNIGPQATVTHGGMRGTYHYMDPYAVSNPQAFGAASDVFSFSIMTWEVLSRKPLYPGLEGDALLRRVSRDGLRPDISALPSDVPQRVRDLITRGWAAHPRDRPTMDEIYNKLVA